MTKYKLIIHRSTEIVKGDSYFGVVVSTSKWIPHVLADIGAVKSTSELKRNRPDLWREVEQGEVISLGRRKLRLYWGRV